MEVYCGCSSFVMAAQIVYGSRGGSRVWKGGGVHFVEKVEDQKKEE